MTTSQNISANQAEHTKMQNRVGQKDKHIQIAVIFEEMYQVSSSHSGLGHSHPQLLNRLNHVLVYKLILWHAFH